MSHADDEKFAALAIEQAAKCVPEDGAKPRPRVGAVLVSPDGEILGSSHRGERVEEDQGGGDHAEYVLLGRKLRGRDLKGATLYTTLEPCVKRSTHKTPCARRVIEAGVSRVVIGMLDPNPDITGRGYWQLRRAGVEVSVFQGASQRQAEDQNSGFSEPYRRFDEVFVSDLLHQCALNGATLARTIELTQELLKGQRSFWEGRDSEALEKVQDHLAWLSEFSAEISASTSTIIDHLSAMGGREREVGKLRDVLARIRQRGT